MAPPDTQEARPLALLSEGPLLGDPPVSQGIPAVPLALFGLWLTCRQRHLPVYGLHEGALRPLPATHATLGPRVHPQLATVQARRRGRSTQWSLELIARG
jgi:hypothetical protein